MSDNTDWTLIVLASQKAQRAAEGSLEITERLKSDLGNRLTGLEGRFSALEGRVTSLVAGQDSLHRAILRIADIQADHTARLDDHTARLTRVEARLDRIEATLADHTGRLDRIEGLLTGIARKLTARTERPSDDV